jgi:hypothetical protein
LPAASEIIHLVHGPTSDPSFPGLLDSNTSLACIFIKFLMCSYTRDPHLGPKGRPLTTPMYYNQKMQLHGPSCSYRRCLAVCTRVLQIRIVTCSFPRILGFGPASTVSSCTICSDSLASSSLTDPTPRVKPGLHSCPPPGSTRS